MANKCTKCEKTDNYNFALNIGLCNICIGEELERIKKLEADLKIKQSRCETIEKEVIAINEKLKAENSQLRKLKCPPISDGDTCICPIEELEALMQRAYNYVPKDSSLQKEFEQALKD